MVKKLKIIFFDPYYYPGSVVNGTVLVSVDEPKDYKEITVKIFGAAHTSWSEGAGDRNNRYYEDTIEYVEKKYLLWSKERAPTGNLPPGEHNFPFSMLLPDDAPPSFNSITGQVTYKVTARIAQDEKLKFGHHADVLLKVVSTIPTASMQPKAIDLDSDVKFCCCFNFGPVHISCSLPRTGFVVGETIPLNIRVENLSNKNVYIRAYISQQAAYRARGSSRSSHRNTSVVRFQDVRSGTQTHLEEASLTIPSKFPGSVSNCPIIKVNHFIVIQAVRSLGSSDKMKIPIFISNAQTDTVL